MNFGEEFNLKEAEDIFDQLSTFKSFIGSDISDTLLISIIKLREYFFLLNRDIEILIENSIPEKKLIDFYKRNFIKASNVLETIYEIHFGALLAEAFDNIDLKVQTSDSSNKDFDYRVKYKDIYFNFEVKSRTDIFPFHGKKNKNTQIYFDRRDTVDKKFINQVNKGDPESNNLRGILSNALQQLPELGINCIAIGQIFCHSDYTALYSLKNALYGDLGHRMFRKLPGKLFKFRHENGVFYNVKFNKIYCVIWYRLKIDGKKHKDELKIFFNKNFEGDISKDLNDKLNLVFNH